MEPTIFAPSDSDLERWARERNPSDFCATKDRQRICHELLEARKKICALIDERDALETKLENVPQKPATSEIEWLKTCISSLRDRVDGDVRALDRQLDDHTERLMALEAWAASIGFKR